MQSLLRARNVSAVRNLLEQLQTSEGAEALVEDVVYTGALILQRRSDDALSDRNSLQGYILNFVSNWGTDDTRQRFREHLSFIPAFDKCFEAIREALSQSAIGQRPVEQQGWAAIDRFVGEMRHLHREVNRSLLERKKGEIFLFDDPQRAGLEGESGKPINPDAVIGNLARGLALTLMKLAHESSWFKDGRLVLPNRVIVGEQLEYESGINSLLAHCWCEVQDASEHIRYLGGTVSERQGERFWDPDDSKEIQADLIQFNLDLGLQYWELLATFRLNRMLFQNITSLRNSIDLNVRIRDPRAEPVESVPGQFVSFDEACAHMISEHVYHLSVVQDANSTTYKGLTLVEWIRGYSVLALYAHSASNEARLELIDLDAVDFQATLRRAGFTSEKARHFLDEVIFGRGKRDLYDAPILLDASGRYYFLAALYAGANIWDIVVSLLGSLGSSFKPKGKAFESYVQSIISSRGLDAKGFTYKLADTKYECDLAFVWERHLFIFECKNDFLPTFRPNLSHYFWLDMLSAAEQVARIASDFRDNRNIVKQHLGTDDWDDVYPVVLNAMPFSLPTDLNGVFFFDASALGRFFKEGLINYVEASGSGEQRQISRVPLKPLWKGTKPSAEDLIAQLRNPAQLSMFLPKITKDWTRIGISENLVLATPLLRSMPLDLESSLSSQGYSDEDVRGFKMQLAALRSLTVSDDEVQSGDDAGGGKN